MLRLLQFPSAFYAVDPCKDRCDEAASSTIRSFSKGDLLCAEFFRIKATLPIFTVLYNSQF